ncbi:MAG: hypothetical protein AAF938_17155 [Myxococcota bacterium]
MASACASSVVLPEDGGAPEAGLEAGLDPDARRLDVPALAPEVRRLARLEADLRELFCRCAAEDGLFASVAACLLDTPLTLDSEGEITCVEAAFQSDGDVPIFNCRVQSFADYVGCLDGCAVIDPAGEAFRRCSEAQQAANVICGGISEETNDARSVCVDQ